MNNDGSGCAGQILVGVLLALVLAVAVAWTGLPTWDAGALNWNTDATYERQLTERERIAEQGRTERERIAADAATSTQWAITLRWLGVAAAVGVGVWAWSRRPHKPVPEPQPVTMLPPPKVVYLLSFYNGSVAEYIDGEWCIVDPRSGEYYTATDARRLLEMRHEV